MSTTTIDRPASTPPRSITQRMDALERANAIRIERAGLKRDLKAGRKHAAPLILNPPAYVLTMKVCDVLMAMPRVGCVKTNRIMMTQRISPSKTIGGLSARQRRELWRVVR